MTAKKATKTPKKPEKRDLYVVGPSKINCELCSEIVYSTISKATEGAKSVLEDEYDDYSVDTAEVTVYKLVPVRKVSTPTRQFVFEDM
jgi:hypothetical protein